MRIVSSMHERKALMEKLSDAFIALPGGYGTIEEIFEMLTWQQLQLHHKPCGFLDIEGYYAPLIAFLDNTVTEGFVAAEHRARLMTDTDPASMVKRVAAAL